MAIDITAIALPHIYNTFGRPVIVTPKVSQPGAAPYTARGIYDERDVQVTATDGSVYVDQVATLDIWDIEFPVEIQQGDEISIPPFLSVREGGNFIVLSSQDNGIDESKLILKRREKAVSAGRVNEQMQFVSHQDATVVRAP